jgi:hypothetical protein
MVMRLRRTREAALVMLLIIVGLASTTWLAFGMSGPLDNAYPVTAATVHAKGDVNECTTGKGVKCTQFTISLTRKATGKHAGEIKGTYRLKAALTNTTYTFKKFTTLSCSNNSSAQFHGIEGKGSGSANKGKLFDTDTSITQSGMFTTVIRDSSNASVVYSFSGPRTNTRPKISIRC